MTGVQTCALPISDHPIASVIHNLFFLSRVSPFPSLNIKITSTIPVASGLGSGAAVTVALTRALSTHIHYPMTDEQVNAFAYEIEKLHHGTPSGIDNTVITYAKPVYFIKGQTMETLKVGRPEPSMIRAPVMTRSSESVSFGIWAASAPGTRASKPSQERHMMITSR